jgi:hypothetical protein
MLRRFTVQALTACDLLEMNLIEIDRMKIEFPDAFEELFKNSFKRLKGALRKKIQALQLCERLTKSRSEKMSLKATEMLRGVTIKQKKDNLLKWREKNPSMALSKEEVHIMSNFVPEATSLKKIDE